MRGKRPFVFSNLKHGTGVGQIASFVLEKGGLNDTSAGAQKPSPMSGNAPIPSRARDVRYEPDRRPNSNHTRS